MTFSTLRQHFNVIINNSYMSYTHNTLNQHHKKSEKIGPGTQIHAPHSSPATQHTASERPMVHSSNILRQLPIMTSTHYIKYQTWNSGRPKQTHFSTSPTFDHSSINSPHQCLQHRIMSSIQHTLTQHASTHNSWSAWKHSTRTLTCKFTPTVN